MQAVAKVKFLGTSPRKMRQVAQLIKGKPVEEALNILNFTPKAAAHHMAKTLKAAAANAIAGVGTAKLKAEDLSVASILVDQAPTAKRAMMRSMGRVYRIRKRFCHLTITVEGEPEKETKKTTRTRRAKKEVEAEAKTSDTAVAETEVTETKKTKKTKKTAKAAPKAKAKKDAVEKNDATENNVSDKEDLSDSENKSEEA